ncbi:MAG: DsrE family protein [Deltaproteobacteria bacterium]|nr:DsrE family protein [Deltaproteobacteria bacterium]
MKVTILMKSRPCKDEARRVLQMAEDMLAQGHNVSLYLLQEAVRLCSSNSKCSDFEKLKTLVEKDLQVYVLTHDAKLRGIAVPSGDLGILEGSYEALVDLMESCDRVVGIL